MTTARALIDETLDLFYGPYREKQNVLSGPVDTDDDVFSFNFELQGIGPGAMIGVDLEVCYVVAITGTGAQVIRAQRGSAAVSHAAGALVTVNPRLSRHAVFRSLNEELYNLHGEGLYQMKTAELTYNSAIQGYGIPETVRFDEVYAVYHDTPGPGQSWPVIPMSEWRLLQDAETDDFASGTGIVLYHAGVPGRQLRIQYRAPFGQLADETSDPNNSTVGFPESANDLLVLGTVLRLGTFREWPRNFFSHQGDSRRAEEVPMGAQVTATRISAQYRQMRLGSELMRLARRYPIEIR